MASTEVKIKTGEYDIIASGQFIGLSDKENSIEITQGTNTVKIIFLFKNDESGTAQLSSRSISNIELEITFLNFDNSLGIGNTSLLKLGTFGGRELFLSYRVFSLTEKSLRTIDYTFYAK